jgi:hypothetical protein
MKNQMCSVFFFLAIAFASSCSSKSDPTPIGANCESIIKKFGEAASAYLTNPTKANCNAYLSAANEYLDRAASCGWSAADIAAAREGIDRTTCP